jgi:glutathione S-transferase
MKLYVSPRAPNPRRVTMFIAEKNIEGIEEVIVNLSENEHKTAAYVARNPFSGVPTLKLDDGRVLSESRAICTYLEGLHPQPNLMGTSFEERAFIEMADRRMELALFGAGLSALEQPQFHDFGQSQGEKMLVVARWLDQHLASNEYVAGDRFTIADITAFCALEFARGLMKFNPGELGLTHLHAYRNRIAQRPSA